MEIMEHVVYGIAAEEITKMLSQNNLLTRMTEFVTDAVPKML